MARLSRVGERLFGCCCALIAPIVATDAAQAGSETVLYSFKNNGTDGNVPGGNLIDINGTLYGTTVVGGASNEGAGAEREDRGLLQLNPLLAVVAYPAARPVAFRRIV